MPKLRIFLVDDHVIVRQGLVSLIQSQPDMEVIGEAADGKTACDRIPRLLPDVAILDMSMPEMDGAQATEYLKKVCPQVKVLALTMHQDSGYIRRMFDAGASGYLTKRAAADDLVHAIHKIVGGGIYLDPSLTGNVVGGFVRSRTAQGSVQPKDLSDRETEVLRGIAQGYSNKEISNLLDISVKTVETYKMRLMEKLELNSRAEIVRYALQQGLLKPDS